MQEIARTTEDNINTRLQELVRETDPEFVDELIDLYVDTTPAQIQNIAKAINLQDHQMLTITAHTLKGNSLNLGAKDLGAAFFRLEELGRSNSPISADVSTKEVENEFEKVKTILLLFKQNKR